MVEDKISKKVVTSIDEGTKEERVLKEKSSEIAQDDSNLMVSLETYLKAGLHIGTKFRTKFMEKFIYKVRSDGLTVLNVQAIDERIKVAAEFIAKYSPDDIVLVGKRENSWRAIKLFAKVTGATAYAGRYHPGILTNPNLEDFREAKLVISADPWPDKDAIRDAAKVGTVTVALCDTNNDTTYIDLAIPCNNKGKKSLGLVFWILAREYMKIRHPEAPEMQYDLDYFTGENEPQEAVKTKKPRFIKKRR
jgi:small subunit ribosomal protein S2